jgi:prepilin-type N-terminal cleavage/methylation domain-containing protein
MNRQRTARRSAHGFTVMELLIGMTISALIATAMAVAMHASFYAYAATAESASAQTSCRLVMQRLLATIRKSTLHDAYDPDAPTLTLVAPGDAAHPLRTVGMQMLQPDGTTMRVWWVANDANGQGDLGALWYDRAEWTSQDPVLMLSNVRCQRTSAGDPYLFTLASRQTDLGLVLSRATVDLAVDPDEDALTDIESTGAGGGARLIGSAMPRKSMEY